MSRLVLFLLSICLAFVSVHATGVPVTTTTTTAPTTTPIISSTATKANIEIKLTIDCSTINADAAKKKKFLSEMTTSIAADLNVNSAQIIDMSGCPTLYFSIVGDPAIKSNTSVSAAVTTLKAKVSSATLSLTSTVITPITVDAAYFKAVEAPGYECYVCSSGACKEEQTKNSPTAKCAGYQTCWMEKDPVKRYCGSTCTDAHKKADCNNNKACKKCCTSARCNKESLSSGQNLVVAPLLMSFAVLLQFLLSASL